MRHPRGTAALAMVFSCVTLATCVFPTERDDSVHVTVDPLPVLIRGTDTYATARAWQILAAGDSQQIANVSFVWSSGDPLTATVDANGHVVGIKSGTTAIRAAAANFDKRAAVGQITLRVANTLEIDSIRPDTVRYGEIVTVYGVGLLDTLGIGLTIGDGGLIPVPFSPALDPNGASRISYWVPPPAHTAPLFYIGAGVFGFSADTVRVIRRDLYEPNELAPTAINLETSRPFPATILNFVLFANPALAFEQLPRDVLQGVDWYRFGQSTPRDLSIILSSDVRGTFQTFLTDSLGFRASDSSYFIGRDAWTFGPGSHACHGAAFGPKERAPDSSVAAFRGYPAGSLDGIAVYGREGRYALTVLEGYVTADKRIPRDAHEEDNYCDAADSKRIPLAANVDHVDTLAIENAHDVDWFRFNVPGTSAQPVRFRTLARPFAAVDSSDIDLYVLNVPAPGDTVMTGVAIAKAGSANDTTLALAPNDYYAVVVDFAGVPTRYSLCIGFPSTPLSPRCAVLPASAPVPQSAAQLEASVLRRSRLEAAIARRGLRLAPLRSRARRQ